MTKRKNRIRIPKFNSALRPIFLVIIIVSVAFAVQYLRPDLGLSSTLQGDIITLLPGLIVTGFGVMTVITMTGPLVAAALPIFGIALWFLMDAMYDLEYVNTTMLSGLTIDQLGMWIVLFGFILGIIVWMRKK